MGSRIQTRKPFFLRTALAVLLVAVVSTLMGCSTMTSPKDELDYTPKVRYISDVREEAEAVSSELYDIIGLRGKVTGEGPGVSLCGEKDPEKFYVIHHPWGLTNVPIEDLKKGLDRLKENMPKRGWKIVSYGPDTSPAKNLELIADLTKKDFSVNIGLLDRTKRTEPDAPKSMIFVDLVSACFQVPEGETVDEY